jgi:DNA-binding response OmpR family regulator
MNHAKLLIVEDEARLAANLRRGLEELGAEVTIVAGVRAAAAVIDRAGFDAIVLDLQLPDGDGIELLRASRSRGVATPVLILTARGALEERVAGLEAGADDYLAKPFAFAELAARIRALIRRGRMPPAAPIRVADLEFDPMRRRLRGGDGEIPLSPKEQMLVELLMRHAGAPVARDAISDVLCGPGYNEFTNVIEVFINRLREKIDRARPAPLIVTVRGVGYMMRAD